MGRIGTASAIALCAVAAWLAGWRLHRAPAVGFDEWALLARLDRAGRYQDSSDKVILDEFAANGRHSKFPPLQFLARVALHRLTGWGAAAARWVSLAELVAVAALVG